MYAWMTFVMARDMELHQRYLFEQLHSVKEQQEQLENELFARRTYKEAILSLNDAFEGVGNRRRSIFHPSPSVAGQVPATWQSPIPSPERDRTQMEVPMRGLSSKSSFRASTGADDQIHGSRPGRVASLLVMLACPPPWPLHVRPGSRLPCVARVRLHPIECSTYRRAQGLWIARGPTACQVRAADFSWTREIVDHSVFGFATTACKRLVRGFLPPHRLSGCQRSENLESSWRMAIAARCGYACSQQQLKRDFALTSYRARVVTLALSPSVVAPCRWRRI